VTSPIVVDIDPGDPWPDVELTMMDLLTPLLAGGGTTVTHTDENLAPPCIQVQRVGGANDGVTDRAMIQVTCYGTTRATAWALSREVEQYILTSPGHAITGDYVEDVCIDRAETTVAGLQLPYENPDIRTVVSNYRIDFRRPW
jgi:hypothetical protein